MVALQVYGLGFLGLPLNILSEFWISVLRWSSRAGIEPGEWVWVLNQKDHTVFRGIVRTAPHRTVLYRTTSKMPLHQSRGKNAGTTMVEIL